MLSFVWFTKWGKLMWCRECINHTWKCQNLWVNYWQCANLYTKRASNSRFYRSVSVWYSWRRICIYFILFYVTFLLEIVGNCASFAGWDSCSLDKCDSLGKAQDLSCIQFFFVVLTTKWSSLLKAVNWKNTLVSLLCNICKSNVTFHMC